MTAQAAASAAVIVAAKTLLFPALVSTCVRLAGAPPSAAGFATICEQQRGAHRRRCADPPPPSPQSDGLIPAAPTVYVFAQAFNAQPVSARTLHSGLLLALTQPAGHVRSCSRVQLLRYRPRAAVRHHVGFRQPKVAGLRPAQLAVVRCADAAGVRWRHVRHADRCRVGVGVDSASGACAGIGGVQARSVRRRLRAVQHALAPSLCAMYRERPVRSAGCRKPRRRP